MPDQPKAAPLPDRKDEFDPYRHPEDASFDKFVQALDRAYHHPWKMFWRAFFQGVASALGAIIGTILLSALIYLVLRNVNFNPTIQKLQDAIIPADIRTQIDQSNASNNQINQLIQSVSPSPVATR